MPLVISDLQENVGTITLNHYEHRNALSKALLEEMVRALAEMKQTKARAIVLRAQKGAKVWSAGHDISELPQPGRDPLNYDDPMETAFRAIQHLPIPVVAMIEGGVFGGACDLVLTCDILVGSPTASFAMTPARLGVPYNASGALNFMTAVGIHTAKEMFFSSLPVPAERALQLGILNHLVPEESIEEFTFSLARRIAENSPLSISSVKEVMRILAGSAAISPSTYERVQALRQLVYESEDYAEGVRAFSEKRKPVFEGK